MDASKSTMALAQFAGMLNALFDARHLRTGTIEASLDGAVRFGLGRLSDANLLDLRLGFPQIRKHRGGALCRSDRRNANKTSLTE